MSSLKEIQQLEKSIVSCYTKHLSEKFNINNKLNFSNCMQRFTQNVTNDVVKRHSQVMQSYLIKNNNKEHVKMILDSIPTHEDE